MAHAATPNRALRASRPDAMFRINYCPFRARAVSMHSPAAVAGRRIHAFGWPEVASTQCSLTDLCSSLNGLAVSTTALAHSNLAAHCPDLLKPSTVLPGFIARAGALALLCSTSSGNVGNTRLP